MITCSDVHEVLSAFVDGEESPAEGVIARAHLESCRACRELLEDWQRIEAALPLAVDALAPTEQQMRALASVPRRRMASLVVAASVVMLAAGVVFAASMGEQRGVQPAGAVTDPARALEVVPSVSLSPQPSREPSARPTAEPSPRPSEEPIAKPTGRPSKEMPAATRGTNGSLVLMLRIERAYAHAGEALQADAVLRNITDRPVTFWSPKESAIDLVIRDPEGDEVYRRSTAEGWSREMVERTLQPGEQLADTFTFTAPAQPGGYQLTGGCLCFPFDPAERPTMLDRSDKSAPFETQPLRFAVARDPS